jgi:hypothetical protein
MCRFGRCRATSGPGGVMTGDTPSEARVIASGPYRSSAAGVYQILVRAPTMPCLTKELAPNPGTSMMLRPDAGCPIVMSS